MNNTKKPQDSQDSQDFRIKIARDRDSEHGMKILKFQAYLEDEKIGSLDIAWISEKGWEIKYPNIWEYLFWVKHWACWSKLREDYSYLTEEQIFEMARLRNGMVTEQSEVEKMEASIWDSYGDEYENYKKYVVDHPSVDYVWISKEHRNKGYGKKLYLYAVSWLQQNYNLPLWSGHTQTREGECLWESFERHFPHRVFSDGKRKFLK